MATKMRVTCGCGDASSSVEEAERHVSLSGHTVHVSLRIEPEPLVFPDAVGRVVFLQKPGGKPEMILGAKVRPGGKPGGANARTKS